MNIINVEKTDYTRLLEIWEESVRATHYFLLEEDLLFMKPLILEYFDTLNLRCVKDESNKILGFIGIEESRIEMLFMHPDFMNKGIGTKLINYAVKNFKIDSVDVNEQNTKAFEYYKAFGFKVIGRSNTDELGKAYPILHMKL